MAIYNGNNKVNLSGIGRVYNGNELVYESKYKGPLRFISTGTSTIQLKINDTLTNSVDIYYSYDNKTWTSWLSGTSGESSTLTLTDGQKIYIWNKNSTLSESSSKYIQFNITGKFAASGNVNSMINYGELSNYCYSNMFQNCTSLTSTPELPATTLAKACYYMMFAFCTSLTSTPELPATTLEESCYASMFASCTSLTSASELPATNLASTCYRQMFYHCTSLKEAPELPAKILAYYCYSNMFQNCKSLTTIPKLEATTLAQGCYAQMFTGSSGLITLPSNTLPATTLEDSCYYAMFDYCENLKSLPNDLLPATTLAKDCYQGMFRKCTSLTNTPYLPAETLIQGCYRYMFKGCTSLKIIENGTGTKIFTCPTVVYQSVEDMFNSTGGATTSDPTATNSYYWYLEDPTSYTITASVSNGTYSGASVIYEGSTASLTITPNDGYTLPDTVIVSGAYYTYDSSTGVIKLTNPYSNVTITADCKRIPIYLISNGDSTVQLTISGTLTNAVNIYYSYDNSNWVSWLNGTTGNSSTINLTNGQKLYIWNHNSTLSNPGGNGHVWFKMTGSLSIDGNISSMMNYSSLYEECYFGLFDDCSSLTNVPKLPEVNLKPRCYELMFAGCTGLTELPSDLLPASTLAYRCYYGMFYKCTGLTELPSDLLPASTLADSCYSWMFHECTSLTELPSDLLPTTTLAPYCYYEMFRGCTGLTSLPTNFLPATTLAAYCYYGMFYKCTSLQNTPTLPATTLAESCYQYMFSVCSNIRIVREINAITLARESCYSMFHQSTSLRVEENGTVGTAFFTCPSTSGLDYPVNDMFTNTGGSFKGTPTAGNTYKYY